MLAVLTSRRCAVLETYIRLTRRLDKAPANTAYIGVASSWAIGGREKDLPPNSFNMARSFRLLGVVFY